MFSMRRIKNVQDQELGHTVTLNHIASLRSIGEHNANEAMPRRARIAKERKKDKEASVRCCCSSIFLSAASIRYISLSLRVFRGD